MRPFAASATRRKIGENMTIQSEFRGSVRRDPDKLVSVLARPEALTLPLARTALLVVDMQNSYGARGGFRDIIGRSLDGVKEVVDNNVRIIDAARRAGLTIIFLQTGWDKELKTAGTIDSPNWHKSNPMKLMRQRPELKGKILTHGSWDYELMREIVPAPEDIIVTKTRYSGFHGTHLDGLLKARNVRHLIITGLTSNVCVESTLRDAYHHEYFCVLIEDATQHSGPPYIRDAVLYNVETFLGWVTSTDAICAALDTVAPATVAAG
jgi:ureidoacrylate peracid hydrolase